MDNKDKQKEQERYLQELEQGKMVSYIADEEISELVSENQELSDMVSDEEQELENFEPLANVDDNFKKSVQAYEGMQEISTGLVPITSSDKEVEENTPTQESTQEKEQVSFFAKNKKLLMIGGGVGLFLILLAIFSLNSLGTPSESDVAPSYENIGQNASDGEIASIPELPTDIASVASTEVTPIEAPASAISDVVPTAASEDNPFNSLAQHAASQAVVSPNFDASVEQKANAVAQENNATEQTSTASNDVTPQSTQAVNQEGVTAEQTNQIISWDQLFVSLGATTEEQRIALMKQKIIELGGEAGMEALKPEKKPTPKIKSKPFPYSVQAVVFGQLWIQNKGKSIPFVVGDKLPNGAWIEEINPNTKLVKTNKGYFAIN